MVHDSVGQCDVELFSIAAFQGIEDTEVCRTK